MQRAIVGISESTRSDLNTLLCEVKKEQGASEWSLPSGSKDMLSQVASEPLSTSRKRLSRDPTVDTRLQHQLKESDKISHSGYRKLQVGIIQR